MTDFIPLFDEPTPAADLQNVLNILINEINAWLRTMEASSTLFPSRFIASMLDIPASVLAFQTGGYATRGDGGGALYIPASGSTTGGFQSFNGAWWQLGDQALNVKMFGALGDGATDDTAAINSAIVAAVAMPSDLFISPGTYKITSALSVAGSLTLFGAGRRVSVIHLSSTTLNAIEVSVTGGTAGSDWARVLFHNFGVTGDASSPSAGALINVQTPDSNPNEAFVARDLWIQNGYNGLHFVSGASWIVDSCYFYGQFFDGIVIEDTQNVDHGDGIISGCTFLGRSALSGNAAVRLKSGGGIRFVDNVVTVYDYGFYVVLDAGVDTSELFITSNRINLTDVAAIKMAKGTGTGFNTVTITGNKLMSAGRAIDLSDANASWLAYVAITGNVIWTIAGGTPTAVDIYGATNFVLSDNVIIDGGGTTPTAINIGSNASGLLGNNQIAAGFTVTIANASANVASAQNIPRSTTAALNAIANAINTTNKFANKVLINTTTGTIVTSAGATAGALWLNLDGTTANTPV